MEAMASGLPCIVSNIRGNVDLVKDHVNGILCDPKDVEAFAEAIVDLYDDKGKCLEWEERILRLYKSMMLIILLEKWKRFIQKYRGIE